MLQRLMQDLCVDEQRGQVLAALVVQFACQAAALFFLCLQDEQCLLPSRCLQLVEHRIECLRQFADLRIVGNINGACTSLSRATARMARSRPKSGRKLARSSRILMSKLSKVA